MLELAHTGTEGNRDYLTNMGTPRHILLGTDFSDNSNAALDTARDYAKAFGAKLTLIHAYAAGLDALGPAGSLEQRMHIGRDVHATLRKLTDRVTGLAAVHTEVVESDDPVTAICDYAEANGIDLIILGSHGRTGVKRLLIGSVAERVARHAPCSVLVARG